MPTHEPIPADFPVRPLDTYTPGWAEGAADPVTCYSCMLGWDDAIPTSYTPAPSARCPFEAFHIDDDDDDHGPGCDGPLNCTCGDTYDGRPWVAAPHGQGHWATDEEWAELEPDTFAARDYEPAVCPNCGRDEHTTSELRECVRSLTEPIPPRYGPS